jgi:glycine betaine/proline transport system ATP-binding protein
MDEPFSALDPLIRTKLQDELVELQRTLRKTILFVTHDLDEALRIGDRISVLEGGRIVQTGTPEDIVLRPQNAYVAEFVRHMNPLTVLRGYMVMTPLAAPQGVTGQAPLPGRYQAVWDERGGLMVITQNGPIELPRAPIDTPLRTLIGLQQSSGHPVLLLDGDRIVGICSPDDVVRALASSHGAVKQAGDAN